VVAEHGLVAAVAPDRHAQPVTASREVAANLVGDPCFEVERSAINHRRAGRFGRSPVVVPRGVTGFLKIHPEVDHVDDDLHVPLGLHVPAHHTEGDPRFAVLHRERRDDRVERALTRFEVVGAVRIEVEEPAAVLQAEAETLDDIARSEPGVVALDQRHHVAVLVGGGQVRRVALVQARVARRDASRGAVHVDQLGALTTVLLGDQCLDGDAHVIDVGVELRAVLEGQLLGLGHHVPEVHRVATHRLQIERLQDVEDLERGDALAVGRQFIKCHSAVVGAPRFDPVGVVLFEVRQREETAVGLGERDDRFGDRAIVVRVASTLGKQSKSLGQVGVAEHLAFPRCLAAGQELGDAETRQTEQRQAVIARRADLEQQTAVISALNVGIAELKGRQENISLEIKGLALRQENLTHRIEQRQTDSRNNSLKIEECREAIGVIEKNILELARRKDGLSEEISRAEEILREKEETLDTEEQESRQLGKRVQEITEGITQVELQRSEKKMQMVHVEERAWEDFNVPLEEMLKHFSTEIDEDEVAGQVTELKAKIAKLGEVNLAALSDYQQTNERFLFLQKQQEDLAESIMALHRTIDKIDKTTTKLFQDTFDQVNEQFKGMFARLFQGGKAELSLVDPDNPLESGIEITASPLGKKMHNITLLSGGEKTMTAIALIFSILKVRPSPFCLLDEVDAPLDEANVIRFQELLKEMSAKTQFIIITHNQKTMTFANTLYGVTMEEQGVSKVVSVNLN